MSRQATKNTTPELELRRRLHKLGLRYRLHAAPLPAVRRTADILFARLRVAVFVDGCFWHQCPQHRTAPRANADWWRTKLDRNVARDRETDRLLAEAGWVSVRVWEHEDPNDAAARVLAVVDSQRGQLRTPNDD